MQSFIRHITGPDERIILLARLHWIYMVMGICWMAALIALGIALDRLLWEHFGSSIPFAIQNVFAFSFDVRTPLMTLLFGATGVMVFLIHAIKMLATEIALTSERLIYKTGLIFVEVEEIDLVEIRAEHVNHGMLGRFLGYGQLQLDSRFVGDIRLPAVKKPYRLLKAMHTTRHKLHDFIEENGASRVGGTGQKTKAQIKEEKNADGA